MGELRSPEVKNDTAKKNTSNLNDSPPGGNAINWDDPELDGDMIIYQDNVYNEQNIFDPENFDETHKANEVFDEIVRSNRNISKSRDHSLSINSPGTPDLGGKRDFTEINLSTRGRSPN